MDGVFFLVDSVLLLESSGHPGLPLSLAALFFAKAVTLLRDFYEFFLRYYL